jgi:hypothetical protein
MQDVKSVENVDLTTLIVDLGTVQIYTSTVQDLIDQACIEFHIDDLLKAGQRQWKAVMYYVGKRLFPDTKVLKDKRLYSTGVAMTNYNRYDYDVLDILCNYYLNLSDRYSKLVSAVAFSYFCNIPTNTIDIWAGDEPSQGSFKIWQKLRQNRKDCILDRAYDSNSPVGAMYVGNTDFPQELGTDMGQRKAITAQELPRLDEKKSQELHAIDTQFTDAAANNTV